jgi:hypothetical protein
LPLRALAKTEAFERFRQDRKRVEMLFAHLKRILRLGRLRLRGPRGAQFGFTLAAIAQNLRRLAKLVAQPRRATVDEDGALFFRRGATIESAELPSATLN